MKIFSHVLPRVPLETLSSPKFHPVPSQASRSCKTYVSIRFAIFCRCLVSLARLIGPPKCLAESSNMINGTSSTHIPKFLDVNNLGSRRRQKSKAFGIGCWRLGTLREAQWSHHPPSVKYFCRFSLRSMLFLHVFAFT